MGATTSEGTGPGIANRNTKGKLPLGVSSLIGPKTVASGIVTLSGTSDYICIPSQIGMVSDYCVILTNNSPVHPYISNALSPVSGTNIWRFQVTAGSNDVIHYIVVKIGNS
jgi:hypothetical protein